MTIFNGFKYNDHHVCVNPEVPYRFDGPDNCHFRISVSETPQGWIYGYDWQYRLRGGGAGCLLDRSEGFSTRSRAIIACAERLLSHFGRIPGTTRATTRLRQIITTESGKKPQAHQYTIFDYL